MQRIGILGCGRVSDRYLEVCRDELRDCQVAAVCDIIPDKAEKLSKALNTEAVYDFDELLSRNIDVTIILTESGKHAEHTLKSLKAGKHVIVEKPPAMLANEIFEIEKFADKNNLI